MAAVIMRLCEAGIAMSLLVLLTQPLTPGTAAILPNNVTGHSQLHLVDSNGETTAEGYQHAEDLHKMITGKPAMHSIRPNIYGKPVHVSVQFYMQSFGPVNERSMDYQLEIYLGVYWVDRRLVFSKGDAAVDVPGALIASVWKPDLYFPNGKEGVLHDLTVTNHHMKVYPNGTVWYNARFSLTLACYMSLVYFPMDYQNCSFKISTYSYTTADLVLNWSEWGAMEKNNENHVYLKQFDIIDKMAGTCSEKYNAGYFSCLQVSFVMRRRLGYFLLQAYVPSTLIIVLSWISFWINKEAVPARISIGVTTVLTMTTQLTGAKSSTIEVSYPKALDVWYTVCMMFVFLAQMEYALINVLARSEVRRFQSEGNRRAALRSLRKQARGTLLSTPEVDNSQMEMDVESPGDRQTGTGPATKLRSICGYYLVTSKGLDGLARVLFPVTFLLFNLVYWPYYLREVIELDVH